MWIVPSLWNKLRQLWRFANDRKPRRLANLHSFAAAFRFSAWFGWRSRSAQTWQQLVDPATHLLRRTRSLLVFPRTQFWFDQIASQHQMVVCDSNDQSPALKLLWCAQTGFFPHQRLFVKAIAMFLPETQRIAQGDLSQIHFLIPHPHKPTHVWIALFVGGMRSHDTQNRHLQPASLFDMHALPPGDFHRTPF